MTDKIVHSQAPVTLIGGGFIAQGDLAEALSHAPDLIAADGGAGFALRAGHVPQVVIGDFDSLTPTDQDRIPPERLFLIREQDSTDFDKALRNIAAPLVLAVGFLGARLDHQLATFNTLVRHPESPCILIGEHELVVHAPPVLSLQMSVDDVVSLFPMRRVTGRSTGLRWPIDQLVLAPDGRVGTSNRASHSNVVLQMDGPGLLAILPRGALPGLMRAIAPAWVPGQKVVSPLRARWPARA